MDPGNTTDEESGKKLRSDSFWVSEDLGCTSDVRGVTEASRGSPDWSDSQRAISLDAAERLAEPSATSLIRSTAVEDLTSIGDRKARVNPEEEQVSERLEESLAQSGFGSGSEGLHQGLCRGNSSEGDCLCARLPCDPGAENSHDSRLHRAGYSEPDTSDDSEMRPAAQATGAAQLQKPPSARKSLVPVAVSKGLFALYLHQFRSSSVSSSHIFGFQCSFCSLICSTLSPSCFHGLKGKLVVLPPPSTLAFSFISPSRLTNG